MLVELGNLNYNCADLGFALRKRLAFEALSFEECIDLVETEEPF
jgi:hypothetical protein